MSAVVMGVLGFFCLAQSQDLSDLTRMLGEAEKTYNLGLARTLVESQSAAIDVSTPTPHRQVYAASLLLRAQLAAIAYTHTDQALVEDRNALKAEVAQAAQECLAQLEPLPNSPEALRMRSDAYAYLAEVKDLSQEEYQQWRAAADSARKMDQANPRAHVAAARYSLAADDPATALEETRLALNLNPVLESAMMVRALALDAAGRGDEAFAAWKQLRAQNPAAPPSPIAAPPPPAPVAPAPPPAD